MNASPQDEVQSLHNSKTAQIVDDCIELWTKMLIADSIRDNVVTNKVLTMQGEAASLLALLKLWIDSLSKHKEVSTRSGQFSRNDFDLRRL